MMMFLLYQMYDESQILSSYGITPREMDYYMSFQITMTAFQIITDVLILNVLELFHGWRLVDYFEYCNYRFVNRPARWKGIGETADETVAPHLRSLDLMCFSEQFYFMCTMNILGIMMWLIGLQIVIVHDWNMFDDPASSICFISCIITCKLFKEGYYIFANYLQIWEVEKAASGVKPQDLQQQVFWGDRKTMGKAAPPGSALANWPEPGERDVHTLQRYREAFLKENQLWLQHSFVDIMDDATIARYRTTLLTSLAKILNEVDAKNLGPKHLGPKVVQGETVERDIMQRAAAAGGNEIPALREGDQVFEFNTKPPVAEVVAFVKERAFKYNASSMQLLARMWIARARFMLQLNRVSLSVTPDQFRINTTCELCGSSEGLLVTPIYTLINMASTFRIQRDMSPLWNMELWRHFYKTFTPTCTICTNCSTYYWKRNIDIPVDAARIQHLNVKPMTQMDMLKVSPYSHVSMNDSERAMLRHWLDVSKRVLRYENWQTFLPLYGYELKGEAPKQLLDDEEEEAQEEVFSDEESSVAISEDWGDEGPPDFPSPVLSWAARDMMLKWLRLARAIQRDEGISSLAQWSTHLH